MHTTETTNEAFDIVIGSIQHRAKLGLSNFDELPIDLSHYR